MGQSSYTIIPFRKLTILSFILLNLGVLSLLIAFYLEGDPHLHLVVINVTVVFNLVFLFPMSWGFLFYSLTYVVIDEQGLAEYSYFGKKRRQFTFHDINSITLLNTGYSFGKAIEIGYIDINGQQKYIMLGMYNEEIVKFLNSHYDGVITIHPTMEGHIKPITQEAPEDEIRELKENKNSSADYRMPVVFITWIALAVSVIINFIILL